MKNYIKISILIIIIVLLGYLLNYLIFPKTNQKIGNYLIKQGYTISEDDDNLYQKQISVLNRDQYDYYISSNVSTSYEMNTFSLSNYRLLKEQNEYLNGVESLLTETYNYTNDALDYTYRIYYDDTNAIFKGSYDRETKKFVCEKEFAYGLSLDRQTVICEKLELTVSNFSSEAFLLFTNADFISYMRNQKVE